MCIKWQKATISLKRALLYSRCIFFLISTIQFAGSCLQRKGVAKSIWNRSTALPRESIPVRRPPWRVPGEIPGDDASEFCTRPPSDWRGVTDRLFGCSNSIPFLEERQQFLRCGMYLEFPNCCCVFSLDSCASYTNFNLPVVCAQALKESKRASQGTKGMCTVSVWLAMFLIGWEIYFRTGGLGIEPSRALYLFPFLANFPALHVRTPHGHPTGIDHSIELILGALVHASLHVGARFLEGENGNFLGICCARVYTRMHVC